VKRVSLTARNPSSLVIDNLYPQGRERDAAVAGLYCDFQARQDQTIDRIMGAILKELVGRGNIPEYLREAFRKEFAGRGLRLPDLTGLLRKAVASLPQVFICIDGLDEFLPQDLPVLLQLLRDIVQESPSTRIFLTGRPTVREAIQECFPEAIVIPVRPNKDDIKSYLEMRLDRDHLKKVMNNDLRADIVRIFQEKMSDM